MLALPPTALETLEQAPTPPGDTPALLTCVLGTVLNITLLAPTVPRLGLSPLSYASSPAASWNRYVATTILSILRWFMEKSSSCQ
jgi:hypothetical protein